MSIYRDYEKVKKTINSCVTYMQLTTAYWVMRNFDKKYPEESAFGLLKTDLRQIHASKCHELKNPKTPSRSKTISRTRPIETEPPIRTR